MCTKKINSERHVVYLYNPNIHFLSKFCIRRTIFHETFLDYRIINCFYDFIYSAQRLNGKISALQVLQRSLLDDLYKLELLVHSYLERGIKSAIKSTSFRISFEQLSIAKNWSDRRGIQFVSLW